MSEKPILMSSPMVRAILSGVKTQTRRVIKPQPILEDGSIRAAGLIGPEMYYPTVIDRNGEAQPGEEIFGVYDEEGEWGVKFPYGSIGSVLWVRETWATENIFDKISWNKITETKVATVPIWYQAGDAQIDRPGQVRGKWRPSMFMPRWASRITLEIKGVRVERVQDISEADAIAEGINYWDDADSYAIYPIDNRNPYFTREPIKSYQSLWDSINGKKYPWSSNPWCWVIEFKK